MNELIEKIEALPSKGVIGSLPYKSKTIDHLCTIGDLKSLANALALANKKIELLQASNDHYADYDTWETSLERDNRTGEISFSKTMDLYIGSEGNGSDVARKTQEQIARLTDEVEHIDNNAEAKRNLLREMGSTRPLDRRDFDIRINKKG